MTKKRSLCVGWTRNTDREVTEIQRTAEDVSCHYLYLRQTQPQPQTVFAQIQNTDLPEPFISFFGSLAFFSVRLGPTTKQLEVSSLILKSTLGPLGISFSVLYCPFSNSVSQSWSSVAVSPPGRFSLNNLPSSVQWRPELWAAVQLLRTKESTTLVCTALCAPYVCVSGSRDGRVQ